MAYFSGLWAKNINALSWVKTNSTTASGQSGQIGFSSLWAYGITMAGLLLLLKWLEWRFVIIDHSIAIYIGLIALFFTFFGIWVAKQLLEVKTQTIVVEKEIYVPVTPEFVLNEIELKKLNLTSREWDVLQLITQGKSNTEIASDLYLSTSTIKTHVSNILSKLEVKSRAQVMEKAKRLKITP